MNCPCMSCLSKFRSHYIECTMWYRTTLAIRNQSALTYGQTMSQTRLDRQPITSAGRSSKKHYCPTSESRPRRRGTEATGAAGSSDRVRRGGLCNPARVSLAVRYLSLVDMRARVVLRDCIAETSRLQWHCVCYLE